MNKKLIALAVAGAMAGPAIAAAADVEVYGKARVSIGFTGNDNETDDVSDSETTITSHSSRFGIKGSEDLGNGLTAVYQIESKVNLDDGGGTLAGRDSFVGLAGGFGTVLLGRHDTPYKLATKKADILGDTYADIDGSALNGVHNDRVDNVLAYISPDMNGFTFIGAYVTDVGVANNDDLDGTDPEDHQSAISLAGMGKIGPVGVSLAYQSIDNAAGLIGGDAEESADAIKLGLGYDINDMASVNFVYEMTEADQWEQDNIALSGSFNISDTTAIKAIYGLRGEQTTPAGGDDIDDSEGSFIALGVTTKLSKNVEAYALYTAVDNDKNAGDGGAELTDGPVAAGDEPAADVFAFGLNISFSSK